MSTLSVTLNAALQRLTIRQEESDTTVLDKRNRIEREEIALRQAQDDLERSLFEEKTIRNDCLELLNYLKDVPNGGTTAERQEQASLTAKLTRMVERSRITRLRIREREDALDNAQTDLEFAQTRHQQILKERLELAERIQRLPNN
jgi:hypothetical protein